MLNSGKKVLPLVLSEENFLNETKNHNPPFKLNGRSLINCNIQCHGICINKKTTHVLKHIIKIIYYFCHHLHNH